MQLEFEIARYIPIDSAGVLVGFVDIWVPAFQVYLRNFRHCKNYKEEWIAAPRQFVGKGKRQKEKVHLIDFNNIDEFNSFARKLLGMVHQHLNRKGSGNNGKERTISPDAADIC